VSRRFFHKLPRGLRERVEKAFDRLHYKAKEFPMSRVSATILTLIFMALAPCAAQAGFPEKEIRILIPYKAGGQSDLLARKLADVIQQKKLLPVSVIVVNMPGGNTIDCLNTLKAAKPDGYTLLFHHTALVTMEALGMLPLSWRDFDMVAQAISMPMMLVVNSDSPWKNAQDMIDAVTKEPGKYSCALPGTGGTAHFAALQFFAKTGLLGKVNQQPLSGANEAITSLMGRRADMRASTSLDAARFMKSGEQRCLVVMDNKPLPGFPDVRKSSEFGLNNNILLRNGAFAPKGLPKDVRAVLINAFKAAVESREFKEFAVNQAGTPEFQGPEEWTKTYSRDQETANELAKVLKK
jgi:tripartite-type tricarboxylate transporter receptor subunit TctC